MPRLPTLLGSDPRARPRAGAGYAWFAGHLLTVWGIALSNALLGLTALFALLRPRRTVRPLITRGPGGTAAVLLPLLLYVLFFLASVLFSYEPERSREELRDVINLLTLPLALLLVAGRVEVRRLFRWLIGLVVVLALYGLGQYLFTDYGGLYRRIPGPFSHYMTFSGILLLGNCLLLARLAVAPSGRRRTLEWLGLGLINLTLILTLTRSAWVGSFVAVVVVLAWAWRRGIVYLLAVLVLVGALTAAFVPEAGARARSMLDPRDPSNYDRVCMLWAGWHMIRERPLYGIGPSMVEERYPIYRHPTAPRLHVAHLHNTFVQLAAERGLLSLVAYLWLTLAAVVVAVRELRRGGHDDPHADLWLGVVVALVAFNVAGLFEANWRDTEVQRWVLFLIAVPWCLRRGAAEETHTPATHDSTAVAGVGAPAL